MLDPRVSICHRCPFNEQTRPGFKGGKARCMNDPAKRSIRERAGAGDCVRFSGTPVVTVTVQGEAPRKPWGPGMWKSLHTAKDADDRWIRSFTANVPCGDCKTHWRAILAEMPPVFGEGWFAWTVEAHNAVNVKLGKPTMTVEAARLKWLTD